MNYKEQTKYDTDIPPRDHKIVQYQGMAPPGLRHPLKLKDIPTRNDKT